MLLFSNTLSPSWPKQMNILSGSVSRLPRFRFPKFSKPLSCSNPRNFSNTRQDFNRHNHSRRLRTLLTPVSIVPKMEGISLSNGRLTDARFSTMSDGVEEIQRGVSFSLSPTSSLVIQKGDITQWFVDGSSDAIVNPANERMLGGGGADGAVHRAAGPELRAACYNVPEVRPGVRCPTGEARITPGFRLPASRIIHTVGPIYDVDSNPEASLRNAYRNSLRVAKENNIEYIAFPAISCGIYGYPFDEAANVAISTVREFTNDFKEVHFVLYSDDIYDVWLDKTSVLFQDHH